MTVELRWPGKYDESGRRIPLPRCGTNLVAQVAFPGSDPARLIHGDNLAILDVLERELRGKVDLIYLDPPFATGGMFSLLTRVGEGEGTRELEQHAYSDRFEGGLAGFLRMLDPRLRLLHSLLSDHGSLYVHVDPTVGHAVKLLLDEVFGPQCFQREIVWRIGWVSGFKSRARNWIRNHDLIFFYTKDPRAFTFNKLYTPYPPGYRRRDGALPRGEGVPVDDVWNANEAEFALRGRESLDSIQIKSFSTEKSGYATQKNVSLLRRIIAASSQPGDLVLDPFCGSGTTGVAAAELGRRFIGCDRNASALHISLKRILEVPGAPGVRWEGLAGAAALVLPLAEACDPEVTVTPEGVGSIRVAAGRTVIQDDVLRWWDSAALQGARSLRIEAHRYRLPLHFRAPPQAALLHPPSSEESLPREVPFVSIAATFGGDSGPPTAVKVEVGIVGYEYRNPQWLPPNLQQTARWSDFLDAWWIAVPGAPPSVVALEFRTHRRRELALEGVVCLEECGHVRVHLVDVLYRAVEVLVMRNGEAYLVSEGELGPLPQADAAHQV